MMSSKRVYELSAEADMDLEEILDYTHLEFGFDQAEKYLTELLETFYQLSINPKIGKERNEIKVDLRSFPKGQHVIFYRILVDRIRIVRIMHGNRDLPMYLK
jgi:toxin ParE1/3/4